MAKKYDILCLPPQNKSVYFIVESLSDSDPESKSYYYEEHSCPTNYIRVVEIITDGDSDPHGLFDYVKTVELPIRDTIRNPGESYNPDYEYKQVIPEAYGEIIIEGTINKLMLPSESSDQG